MSSKFQELLSSHVIHNKNLHELLLGMSLGVAGTLVVAKLTSAFKSEDQHTLAEGGEGSVKEQLMMIRREKEQFLLEDNKTVTEEEDDEEWSKMSLEALREEVVRMRQARVEAEARLALQQEQRRKMEEIDRVEQINTIRKHSASSDEENVGSESEGEYHDYEGDEEWSKMSLEALREKVHRMRQAREEAEACLALPQDSESEGEYSDHDEGALKSATMSSEVSRKISETEKQPKNFTTEDNYLPRKVGLETAKTAQTVLSPGGHLTAIRAGA